MRYVFANEGDREEGEARTESKGSSAASQPWPQQTATRLGLDSRPLSVLRLLGKPALVNLHLRLCVARILFYLHLHRCEVEGLTSDRSVNLQESEPELLCPEQRTL